MWPALVARCRRALPAHLTWAVALLDPERPLPVICGEPEVREFFHWLESLPNTERVSIGCERQGPPQGSAGVGPRAVPGTNHLEKGEPDGL
jgi:hypothetical protein